MRHSLRAHITYLENTIRSVKDRLGRPRLSTDEINDLELQLTLAESALEHYRQAYELEMSVTGPEPPERPDALSKGGNDHAEDRNGEEKKGGLAGIARRMRRRIRAGFSPVAAPPRKRVSVG